MILSCPSCNTRYNLDATALKGGQIVRCVRCGTTWHQDPPDDLPIVVEVEVAAEDEIPDQIPLPDDELTESVDVPNIVRRRPAPSEKTKSSSLGWMALAVVLVLSVSLLIYFRNGVVAAWPPAERLYTALWLSVEQPNFGLELRNLASSQAFDGDVPMLSVTGQVVNVSEESRIVPQVRIGLSNDAGREIYHWTFVVPDRELDPGQTTGFSTTLASPPETAKRIGITFVQE